MPGDSGNRNEDELLSQIDELKARMDRLMSGGSSTSNSALLTDKPEAKPPTPPPVAPPPAPNRTRVRDLIDAEETETIEVYSGPDEAVPFLDKQDSPVDGSIRAEEPSVERPAAKSGSVISVEAEATEERPQVATFDDLGSAIQQELARDDSIPPAELKKGPDLASRFGPVEGSAVEPKEEAVDEDEVSDRPDVEDETEVVAEQPEDDFEVSPDIVVRNRSLGKVAAIWAVTAVASGAIATLHFAGII